MTIEGRIARQVRAFAARARCALAGTDEASRRRTDIGSKPPRGAVDRAVRALRRALER